jgi:hypothetical protein
MAVNLSLIGGAGWQFFDDNGVPLAGGKIYTYAAGTTTPQTTYTSYDGLTPNTNPIILDAAGRTPQQIWSTEGLLYKYTVYTSNDVLVRTWDNIGGTIVASDLAQELANTTTANKGDALVGFRQSDLSGFLSGAVGRTVNDKLQEFVSVKDFGALGDGVTDDTVAVQAAVNAAPNILFPPGTYILNNVIVPANRSIFSQGGATVKLKPQAPLVFNPIFNVTGGNISFDRLVFDGNRANQPVNGFSDSWNTGPNGTGKSNRAGVYMDGTYSGLSVVNCEFTAFYAGSIATQNVSNIVIDKCYFHDSNLEACFLYASSGVHENAKVTSCAFKNLYSGDPVVEANCIVTTSYDGVIVANNTADNFARNFSKLELCSRAIVTGNKMSNNRIEGFNCMQAQSGGVDITFSNNVARNVKRGLLISLGNFSQVSVLSNIFDTASSISGSPDGIAIENAEEVFVSGNLVKNVDRYAFYVSNCRNTVLTNNVSSQTTNKNFPSIGFFTSSTTAAGNVVISGHNSSGTQSSNDGIVAFFGNGTIDNLVLVGNSLRGASAANSRGIYTNGASITFTTALVADNVLSSDCTIEMYYTSASNVVVRNNVVPRVTNPAGVFHRALAAAAAAPTTGTYYQGDVVLHSAPVAGGNIGWVCTTSGTPGTWRTWGTIA